MGKGKGRKATISFKGGAGAEITITGDITKVLVDAALAAGVSRNVAEMIFVLNGADQVTMDELADAPEGSYITATEPARNGAEAVDTRARPGPQTLAA